MNTNAFKAIARPVFYFIRRIFRKLTRERTVSTSYWSKEFIYPSRSDIGRIIKSGEKWDYEIFSQLQKLFNDKSIVMIEVGSNIGASSITINNLFTISEQLLVEPSHRYLPYLKENTKYLNGVLGIDERIVGRVSKNNYVLKTNSTTGTPSNAVYGGDETSSQQVESVTLDDLVNEYRIKKIDLIKVDTDGFEFEVFLGAKKTIYEHKPLIFTEFSPQSLNRVGFSTDLIKLLIEYGCNEFYVFSSKGQYIGRARSHNEIIQLKGASYYVDLVTSPANGVMAQQLSENFSEH